MKNYLYLGIPFIGIPVSIILIEIVFYYYKNRAKKDIHSIDIKTLRYIKILAYSYVIITSINLLLNSIPFIEGLSFIYILIIGLIIYEKNIRKSDTIHNVGSDLNSIVDNIFTSDEFYKVLSTSLPKGDKDGEYGLDYIPYMLYELKKKKERFRKSSSYFLVSIVLLSAFFIFLIVGASYFLLQESSIGFYKDLKDLEYNTQQLNNSIKLFAVYDKEQPAFKSDVQPLLNSLDNFPIEKLSKDVKPVADSINISYLKFIQDKTLNSLANSLINNRSLLSSSKE